MKKVFVEDIKINGDTQPRVSIDISAVDDYAASYEAGKELPPVVVFNDGVDLWLADGFHRWHAARKALMSQVDAEVLEGTRMDAQWHAIAANQTHGIRRTNADKRRSVKMGLSINPEWSDCMIADHVGVSHELVRTTRSSLADSASQPTSRVTKGGRTVETENIGEKPPVFTKNPPMPEIRLDAVGAVIPHHLVGKWDSLRSEVKGLISSVREIKRWAEKSESRMDAVAADIAINSFVADCNNLLGSLKKTGLPHAICVYCNGDGCAECSHRGWVSEQLWNCVAEEMKS